MDPDREHHRHAGLHPLRGRARHSPAAIREQLLRAARHVFATAGYRGATTRRIAQEAGLSEITLFRHFGSKDSLIHEALREAVPDADSARLPDVPQDPERELTVWCQLRATHIHNLRSLIRTAMGEIEEHPEIIPHAGRCPGLAAQELRAYLERLRAQGRVDADVDPGVASAMLMGALFAAAIGRDVMPEVYGRDAASTVSAFVRLFLRGIGAGRHGPRASRATPHPHNGAARR
ncbi:MAG TPA: TetR family transcriptional regulator [Gemmatimonadaceae bacterium]|nr:TetR family transcriptional regulator [Gemmatimonadaceae bacterium]